MSVKRGEKEGLLKGGEMVFSGGMVCSNSEKGNCSGKNEETPRRNASRSCKRRRKSLSRSKKKTTRKGRKK